VVAVYTSSCIGNWLRFIDDELTHLTMNGWIKLHRTIADHWIWADPIYLKAWLYCLIRANHDKVKLLIGGSLCTLERGSFITSIEHFSIDTGLSAAKTRHFWNMLEMDGMIRRRSDKQKTKLTICNYDTYQDTQQTNNKQIANQSQTNRKQTTIDKNDKNEKNEKEEVVKRFSPPDLMECIELFIEIGSDQTEAEKFHNHYSANGWMAGRFKMKSWPHAARKWVSRVEEFKPQQRKQSNTIDNHYSALQ